MSIVPMQKIQLVAHRSQASAVLDVAQRHGVIHFTEVPKNNLLREQEKKDFDFNYYTSRLDFTVSFLSRYDTTGFFKTLFEGRRVVTTRADIENVVRSFYFNDVISTAQNLGNLLNEIEQKIFDLRAEKALLTQWTNLETALDVSFTTTHTVTLPLKANAKQLALIEASIIELDIPYEFQNINETTALLTLFKEHEAEVATHLKSYKTEIITLPKRRGTPLEEIARIDRRIKKLHARQENIHEQARKLSTYLPEIKMVADYISWKKEKSDVLSIAPQSDTSVIFEGWCPTARIEPLHGALLKKTPLFSLEPIDAHDEEPPVELQNHSLIKPFETITRLYGVPGYKDLDPTLFLASFFFIFFGLSLTDVGYGIIMAGLIAIVLNLYTIPKEMRLLLKLLMFGGLSSALIGLFFGGYFGIDMTFLPAPLQSIQLFDPIKNPLPIFYLALVLGFIQVMFGFILKIVREAKNNNLAGGLLDQIPWLALFIVIALAIGNAVGMYTLPQYTLSILTGISLVAIVATQGRTAQTIVGKFFSGTLSLYGFIGYFSDVLSYSRLLALGLATSALAFSVNMIGLLVKDLIPVIGPILMVLVLVVGHVFTLLVNALGAFIHSARLQFVEFFGKFIIGTGTEFKPFSQAERYVILDE